MRLTAIAAYALSLAVAAGGIAREGIGDIEGARTDYDAVLTEPANVEDDMNAQEEARERLTPLSTGAGRRVALIIGNSSYTAVAALPNPAHDADMLARALRRIGFQTVTLSNDLGYQALNDTLHAFPRETERVD